MLKTRGIDMRCLRVGEMHYHLRPAGVKAVIENTIDALMEEFSINQLNIFVIADFEKKVKLKDLKIRARLISGKKLVINKVDIPEINYDKRPAKNKKEFLIRAALLKKKIIKKVPLNKCSVKSPFILHIHNVSLGKNPYLCCAIRLLAEESFKEKIPLWMLNQVHDFPENSRPKMLQKLQYCTGKRNAKFAAEIAYPNYPNVFYATINSNDLDNLKMIGINKDRVFLLQNSVDVDFLSSKPVTQQRTCHSMLINKLHQYSLKNGYYFDRNRRILLSPLRLMRRKNNFESLLLLILLNHLKDNFQLLITLNPLSEDETEYEKKFKNIIKKKKLPVVVGLGNDFISSSEERIRKSGKLVKFNLVDVFSVSDAILTTSVMEGFGFSFIEGWLANKVVLGRKLPYVNADFEKNGLNLKHMYSKLWVPLDWIQDSKRRILNLYTKQLNVMRKKYGFDKLSKKEIESRIMSHKCKKIGTQICIDFKDLGLGMQLEFINALCNDHKKIKRIFKINPGVKTMFNMLMKRPKKLIAQNKKVVVEKYGLKEKRKKLRDIIVWCNTHYLKPIKQKNIDNKRVIEKYLDIKHVEIMAME